MESLASHANPRRGFGMDADPMDLVKADSGWQLERFQLHPESRILHLEHMKTTLALSIIKNIKNIDIVDVANGSYDLKSSIPLILNHIPKRDYDTIDEVIEFISDELDDAIERKIEASTKWKNSPILTEAQLRMEFWHEVYEVATLHLNGVTA